MFYFFARSLLMGNTNKGWATVALAPTATSTQVNITFKTPIHCERMRSISRNESSYCNRHFGNLWKLSLYINYGC